MSDMWYMPNDVTDRTAPNRLADAPPVGYEHLRVFGSCHRRFDAEEYATEEKLNALVKTITESLSYSSHDVISCGVEQQGAEAFEKLAADHFAEHLHTDDEVRLIVDGEGYFDLRDEKDAWVRILTKPGDCLIVPAGIYHRFTTTEKKYVKAVRLFKDNVNWTPLRRGPEADATPARRSFLEFIAAKPKTIVGEANGAANNLYVERFPSKIDDAMNAIAAGIVAAASSSSESAAVMMYITGAVTPFSKNESWCPDCVVAKPVVREAFEKLRSKLGEKATAFVECPLERTAYLRNPQHPHRLHPLLKLVSVPTVLVLVPVAGAADLVKKGNASWQELLEVKVRNTDPTAAEQLLAW